MANIIFTEEEVRQALPKTLDGRVLASRWEMFADKDPNSKYARGNEAAELVHESLVEMLTSENEYLTLDMSKDPDTMVEDISSRVGSVIAGKIHDELGEYFGFNDTEPRYHLRCFFRRLFRTDRHSAF